MKMAQLSMYRVKVTPSTEENRSQSLAEGSELLTEVSQEDLQGLLLTPTATSCVRFERNTCYQYKEML